MSSLWPHRANLPDISEQRNPIARRPLRPLVRTFPAAIVLIGALACPLSPVNAQQSDSPGSLERVRVALQRPQSLTGGLNPPALDERRIGPLTFAPPEARGEFVRVRVPVGALVGRLTHSIAAARHRRAERAARVEVASVRAELQKAQ